MTISAIKLRNFKGFLDASIELKPITVLLGPNSAGKSSFGHALAAMAHCQWLQGNSEQATLTPGNDSDEWPVDLGTFADLLANGVDDSVYVGVKTSEGWVELGFGVLPPSRESRDLLISYLAHPGGMHTAVLSSPPFEGRPTARVPDSTTGTIPAGVTSLQDASQGIVLRRINEVEWKDEINRVPAKVGLAGLVLETMRHEGGTPAVLNTRARTDFRTALEKLVYLRANRKRPSRNYDMGKGRRRQPIGYAGEWTASILYEFGPKDTVQYAELPRIPQTNEEALALQFRWNRKTETLATAVQAWLEALQLASKVEIVRSPNNQDLVRLRVAPQGQQMRDITEVGFGLSQVIPVITAGLRQPEDSIFIVDLPEAHLHPRPQAALADFFCSLALTGRTSLIETHSEMFFHRLRLRAEMHPELNDMIAVYFVDQPKDGRCCHPRPIGLTYDKELDWPVGFFQEGWDIETQINALRQARSGIKLSDG